MNDLKTTRAFAWILPLLGGVALGACTNAGDARSIETAPDRTTFPVVSDLLDHRCGSLDCHGKTARNLRIYGHEGLRLLATDRPSSTNNTTTAEYDETYQSLVSLEPEVLTAVVTSGGANPERLTFVRKARGTEAHKANQIWTAGDESDRCITSWLANATDVTACQHALATTF